MTAHSQELNPEHLRKLSSEVSRIATTLARLSAEPVPAAANEERKSPPPEISTDTVISAIRARRLRERYFQPELFADPAWDIMLELFAAELSHRRVAVSLLCAAAGVPPTTALRWIKTMTDKGLIIRRDDPLDGRRVYVELSHESSVALREYFEQIGTAQVI
jgi:DNA-binding MarR family transcriptional regulator